MTRRVHRHAPRAVPSVTELTACEALVAEGLDNAGVAERLADREDARDAGVVEAGLRDRVRLVICAYETGLVRPGG